MPSKEIEQFLEAWEQQGRSIVRVIETLPPGQYDFRPVPGGRSIGEMAWHLAELDGYVSHGVERGTLSVGEKPPGMERPKDVAGLLAGFERVHAAARARFLKLEAADLERSLPFFDGRVIPVRDILWAATLHHSIHHLAQLVLMCRMAGGTPPGLYGPNAEQTAAMKAAAAAARA